MMNYPISPMAITIPLLLLLNFHTFYLTTFNKIDERINVIRRFWDYLSIRQRKIKIRKIKAIHAMIGFDFGFILSGLTLVIIDLITRKFSIQVRSMKVVTFGVILHLIVMLITKIMLRNSDRVS